MKNEKTVVGILLIVGVCPGSSSEKNDVRSKSTNQNYRDNWDSIFGKNTTNQTLLN
jgi:hypothetical protein